MKKHFLMMGAAVVAIGFCATLASAVQGPCTYSHPKKGKGLSSSLVQAFVSCNNPGGNTANATTEGGTPSCVPVETYNEQAGSPPHGWKFDPAKGSGSISFKAAKNKLVFAPNGTIPRDDLAIQLKMAGVLDANTNVPVASGTGTLSTVARATLNDPGTTPGGPMTVVDFPAPFTFPISAGKVGLKTTANALLNGAGIAGLPTCSSIEVVTVQILDSNGTFFANLGTFLP